MSDLIKREDAIKAVEECLKLLARPRYTVKTAIEAIPSVDIPHSDDWEKYSDKLWKNAYERGKADRPQGWIPCSERLPEEKESVYLICTDYGYLYSCRWTQDIYGLGAADEWSTWGWNHADVPQFSKVVAWMDLKPWKGADDVLR